MSLDPQEERMAASEEWTDDEFMAETNRLRSWIFVQRLPVEEMARMLLHERSVLQQQVEFLRHLHGLDFGRELANVGTGIFIGCAVSAVLVWAL